MISTKKKLDREERESYNLRVMATDQSLDVEARKSSTVPVQIRLEDVQDSTPNFRKKLYQVLF